MKNQITRSDVVQLDYLAVAIDGLQDAQDAIASSIVHLLGIDSWDRDKVDRVTQFVHFGHGPIEPFLEQLGVAVATEQLGIPLEPAR